MEKTSLHSSNGNIVCFKKRFDGLMPLFLFILILSSTFIHSITFIQNLHSSVALAEVVIRFKSYVNVLNNTMSFSPSYLFDDIPNSFTIFDSFSPCKARRLITVNHTLYHYKMLNVTTCFQFPVLEKIAFPGKKTFGNLERNVVEKRQKESPQHSHYRFYHFLS